MRIIWLVGYLIVWVVGELGTVISLFALPVLGNQGLPLFVMFCAIWGIAFWIARHEPDWQS
jgi:hypothetical protein